MSATPSTFVSLNSFQGPWPALAKGTALTAKAGSWMLKQVQHDEWTGAPSCEQRG
jgi:hypothetical protein